MLQSREAVHWVPASFAVKFGVKPGEVKKSIIFRFLLVFFVLNLEICFVKDFYVLACYYFWVTVFSLWRRTKGSADSAAFL